MGNLDEALSLLAVGMVTVFIILGLVIVIGTLVIRLTNRILPVAPIPANAATGDKKLHSRKLAAIVAAVDIVTGGKGRVNNIEKK